MEKKSEIRRRIGAERKKMSPEKVEALSQQICRGVLNTKEYQEADKICLYMPINNEVDVTLLKGEAWAAGKQLFLPKTRKGEMDFYRFDASTGFVDALFGIKEPVSDEKLVPDGKTLILVPGTAFTEAGDRIGYGGGFYDRYLEKWPDVMTLGVCYGFQMAEEIPAEDHDKKIQGIVNENTCILHEKILK